jgi:hypothetical protein
VIRFFARFDSLQSVDRRWKNDYMVAGAFRQHLMESHMPFGFSEWLTVGKGIGRTMIPRPSVAPARFLI